MRRKGRRPLGLLFSRLKNADTATRRAGALRKAEEGVYRMSSLRNTPARMLSKYFVAKKDAYVVRDDLKRNRAKPRVKEER